MECARLGAALDTPGQCLSILYYQDLRLVSSLSQETQESVGHEDASLMEAYSLWMRILSKAAPSRTHSKVILTFVVFLGIKRESSEMAPQPNLLKT